MTILCPSCGQADIRAEIVLVVEVEADAAHPLGADTGAIYGDEHSVYDLADDAAAACNHCDFDGVWRDFVEPSRETKLRASLYASAQLESETG